MTNLTKEDKKLIKTAKTLCDPSGERKIKGGVIKEVGCALITDKGKIFTGVSLGLYCGIGFCAEHTAISQMITKTDETKIKTIVASSINGAIPPCGRCRELMNLLNSENINTAVIISNDKKVTLKELLPFAWS